MTTAEDVWADSTPVPPEPTEPTPAPPAARRPPVNGHQGDDSTRPPPQDIAAERAVLGGCILDPTNIAAVSQIVADQDFYSPLHEIIWTALEDLDATGKPVEPAALAHHLGTDLQRFDKTAAYLLDLTSDTVAASATYYARIVAETAHHRRTVALGQKLVQAGYNTTDPATVAGWLQLHTARAERGQAATSSSWQRVDLGPILASSEDTSPRPALLTRRDGAHLLYPGYIHSVSGEPGSGKTWLAALCVVQEIAEGHDVAYLDFEDRAESLVQRLRDMGATDDQISKHLRYVRPTTALDAVSRRHAELEADGTTLAVIDGITEAMTMHNLSLMDNEDVARWLDLIPRRLSDLGPAVLQIDHVVKNSEARGRYAIGGQHKLAGINGVAYKMTTVHSFGEGVKGRARLVIDKDRHGHVGPNGSTAAELTLDATDPTGVLYAWLDTALVDHAEDGSWRPTGYMEKVSRHLEVYPGGSQTAIERGVTGKRDHVRSAIAALIAEAYIRTEDGPRRTVHHYNLRPFREDEQ